MKPTAQTMSGLAVLNDTEFTRAAQGADHRFHQRLAFTPFYPLAAGGLRRHGRLRAAPGQQPLPSGRRRRLAQRAHRPGAQCGLPPIARPEQGLRMVFYANLDTACADLLAGNLDVLDTVPTSALPPSARISGTGR